MVRIFSRRAYFAVPLLLAAAPAVSQAGPLARWLTGRSAETAASTKAPATVPALPSARPLVDRGSVASRASVATAEGAVAGPRADQQAARMAAPGDGVSPDGARVAAVYDGSSSDPQRAPVSIPDAPARAPLSYESMQLVGFNSNLSWTEFRLKDRNGRLVVLGESVNEFSLFVDGARVAFPSGDEIDSLETALKSAWTRADRSLFRANDADVEAVLRALRRARIGAR